MASHHRLSQHSGPCLPRSSQPSDTHILKKKKGKEKKTIFSRLDTAAFGSATADPSVPMCFHIGTLGSQIHYRISQSCGFYMLLLSGAKKM